MSLLRLGGGVQNGERKLGLFIREHNPVSKKNFFFYLTCRVETDRHYKYSVIVPSRFQTHKGSECTCLSLISVSVLVSMVKYSTMVHPLRKVWSENDFLLWRNKIVLPLHRIYI